MLKFRTHTGEIVTGEKLQKAIDEVAEYYRKLAVAIRKEDCYASHVTEEKKDQNMQEMIASADKLKDNLHNFTIWQKINTALTGECIGFLPN